MLHCSNGWLSEEKTHKLCWCKNSLVTLYETRIAPSDKNSKTEITDVIQKSWDEILRLDYVASSNLKTKRAPKYLSLWISTWRLLGLVHKLTCWLVQSFFCDLSAWQDL